MFTFSYRVGAESPLFQRARFVLALRCISSLPSLMICHEERLHWALFSLNDDGSGCVLLASWCLSMSSRNVLSHTGSTSIALLLTMTSRRQKDKERELQSGAAVVVVSSRKYSVDRRGARDISRIIEAFKNPPFFPSVTSCS